MSIRTITKDTLQCQNFIEHTAITDSGSVFNTVLPGFIETPMTEVVPDNVKHIFMKRIPLRRMGKPEEVAEVIAFLGSSKSSYVNGATVDVTGGL